MVEQADHTSSWNHPKKCPSRHYVGPWWRHRKPLKSPSLRSTSNLHQQTEQFPLKKNWGLTERLLHNKWERHTETGRRDETRTTGTQYTSPQSGGIPEGPHTLTHPGVQPKKTTTQQPSILKDFSRKKFIYQSVSVCYTCGGELRDLSLRWCLMPWKGHLWPPLPLDHMAGAQPRRSSCRAQISQFVPGPQQHHHLFLGPPKTLACSTHSSGSVLFIQRRLLACSSSSVQPCDLLSRFPSARTHPSHSSCPGMAYRGTSWRPSPLQLQPQWLTSRSPRSSHPLQLQLQFLVWLFPGTTQGQNPLQLQLQACSLGPSAAHTCSSCSWPAEDNQHRVYKGVAVT